MPNNVVTVEVKGLDEIEQKLYDLPAKFARRAMREAIRPAVEIWRVAIQAWAQTGKYATGFMASHVGVKIKTSSREEAGTGMVGFTTEQNTSRHAEHIPSAANEALWKEFGTVKQPAQPGMRPAFDAHAPAVLETFTNKLKEIFSEEFGA